MISYLGSHSRGRAAKHRQKPVTFYIKLHPERTRYVSKNKTSASYHLTSKVVVNINIYTLVSFIQWGESGEYRGKGEG